MNGQEATANAFSAFYRMLKPGGVGRGGPPAARRRRRGPGKIERLCKDVNRYQAGGGCGLQAGRQIRGEREPPRYGGSSAGGLDAAADAEAGRTGPREISGVQIGRAPWREGVCQYV